MACFPRRGGCCVPDGHPPPFTLTTESETAVVTCPTHIDLFRPPPETPS